ncbi:hypothetical protein M409DRAFT_62048 [Zasmidium cellare ATCC 36951]|uniref:SET domain-containing protein n=1 Tax=Zasmidium cellare ATCC 36951 TaxID=1080233 RepID=A0A6A6D315_ZASCE|nr:uncharacterized protein M409DRAFT_62048 [Zasmidium cellare ATCC 36951]KAF2173791.1 hypothetical protein M409DRAFT_62048 [Zasmidium cellare ATCC 36951]
MDSKGAPYTLKDMPGKGKGLVASDQLLRGTCVIDEAALFTTESLQNPAAIERDLGGIVKSLPKKDQTSFLSLHNNYPGKNAFSNIVRSNGYPLGPSSEIGGIFLETARINHSCQPNAQHAWNEKLQRTQVHAVRDIEEGEEITLSYTYFGFDCGCHACSLPSYEQKVSDERLKRAQRLDEAIGDSKRVRYSPEKALNDCHALQQIYEEEQIFDLRLPRLYYDAFQICAMHSDQARASIFARRARETRIICEGRGSGEAAELEKLASHPEKFQNSGVTTRWKSRADDVPQDSDSTSFEKWLWKDSCA